MIRLVQRLINTYESRPSEGPERHRWDVENIGPAKTDLLRFANHAFTMEQMKKMKRGLQQELSEALILIQIYQSQLELLRKKYPDLFDSGASVTNGPAVSSLFEELEDLIERLERMITIIEAAELSGAIEADGQDPG